jgi:hypothetical protein
MMNNFERDSDYDGINDNTPDEVKINMFLLKLINGPDYVDYDRLKITEQDCKHFNVLLKQTGFVQSESSHNSFNPVYKLSDQGVLLIKQFGNYTNYIDNLKSKELQQDKINRDKEIIEKNVKK